MPPVFIRPLPKVPVLGWRSFSYGVPTSLPGLCHLPERALTTSGRAAMLAALRQLVLPPGSVVLVPTYHCPTMVAPILHAGLTPAYFPIGADGLPQLDGISAAVAAQARAMFVAHYFGLPQSLQAVSDWCRSRQITLIEDCAHSFFGRAGDRPIGAWGDYATASLTKFFPVAEAGLLASAHQRLKPLGLRRQGAKAQLKGLLDVFEFAHQHAHLGGISHLLDPLFKLKGRNRPVPESGFSPRSQSPAKYAPPAGADAMMAYCDMGRVEHAPTAAAMALYAVLPHGTIVNRRRANYLGLSRGLAGASGAHVMRPVLPDDAAPYVLPLWVDDAQRADLVYAGMRAAGLPVFRWDLSWPGTPIDPQDTASLWNRQVLQLLCHQNLDPEHITRMAHLTVQLLQAH